MFVAPLVLVMTLAPGEKRVVPVPPVLFRQRVVPLQIQQVQIQPLQIQIGGGLQPFGMPAIGPGIGMQPLPLPGSGMNTTGAVSSIGGLGDPTILKNARLGTTDDELLAFFRKRTPPAPAKEALIALIKKMGDKDTSEADKAQAELTSIGPAAVPLLRQASNNTDLGDGAIRAKQCLANIEGPTAGTLVIHAARLLATRKPAGAAEVLVAYLPYAEDDTAFLEIEAALVAVAVRDGKPDPAILKALKDRAPTRRGAAANALCQAGGTAFHAEIRPLLKDPRPSVRLRSALGLVSAYDAEAIPVLIDLLGDLEPALRVPVEEFLANLAGEWAVSAPRGSDALSRRLRRDVWAAWWKNVEGSALLREIQSRTISNEDREKLEGLIKKLGDASAETREAASTGIVAVGKKAGPMLRQAIAGHDPRISAFAAKCIEAIDKDAEGPLPAATTRLLALRRPEGTVAALVAYLPFAESPDMQNQIVDILAAIGCPAGKADADLVKGLDDTVGVRRACVAAALCKGKAKGQLPALRKLLEDKDHQVVLRTALGLAHMGQNEAIPALIGLLKNLPIDQAWEVEEFLDRIAGDKAPTEILSPDVAGRTKAVAAWSKWWKENNKGIDLAKIDIDRRERGVYLLVEQYNPAVGKGRVLEVDASGKIRWEVRNLNFPWDAQVLRNGNILVVEQQNSVTERDRTGRVIGPARYYGSVFHAERLRDGNTFIACRNQLIILDAKQNQVFTHSYHLNSILAARRFRDGSIAYVSYSGHYVKLDAKGTQVKTMNLNWVNRAVSGADILPDGRVILSDQTRNSVIEYDADGKQVWECSVPVPGAPSRTASGNIVLTGNNNLGIYEIDRKGKLVKKWEGFTFRPMRVFRR